MLVVVARVGDLFHGSPVRTGFGGKIMLSSKMTHIVFVIVFHYVSFSDHLSGA